MPLFTSPVNNMWFIRDATPDDLNALVHIAIAAMPMDPQWDYRFPLREKYAQDTYDFTYLKYEEFMNSPQFWRITVAERCAADPNTGLLACEVGAFAIWEVSSLPERLTLPALKPTTRKLRAPSNRRDANLARTAAWSATMPRAKEQLFNAVYGDQHLHLQILATHPTCQRQGAGATLCLEGMAVAERRGLVVTVFASPMGQQLYSKLGFRRKAEVLVQVPGEQQNVTIVALAYHPIQRYRDRLHVQSSIEEAPPLVSVAA